MRRRLLLSLLLFGTMINTTAAFPSEERCVNLTWHDAPAGSPGRTIKGILYPVENKLIYDWKNGTMDFLWSLPEGLKSGDPDGFEGTWQQDDGKGTFSLKENRKTAIFEGQWKKQGSKQRGRLKVEYCKN